jgi:hypothetical protein
MVHENKLISGRSGLPKIDVPAMPGLPMASSLFAAPAISLDTMTLLMSCLYEATLSGAGHEGRVPPLSHSWMMLREPSRASHWRWRLRGGGGFWKTDDARAIAFAFYFS